MNFLKMYCVHCKGVMVANDEKDILNCPYCGALFVVRQAVKDYQINIGNSLDAKLRYSLDLPNTSEEPQRMVEYKIIEQKPIITPISNPIEECEQIEESDEFLTNETESLDVNEDAEELFELTDSTETNELNDDEIYSKQNENVEFSETAKDDEPELEDNQTYETMEQDEQSVDYSDESEDLISNEDDGETACEIDKEFSFDEQNEEMIDGEQDSEQDGEQAEEVDVANEQIENFDEELSKKESDVFVDPFENQQSFQSQLKELYYKAHPEAEFEQQNEVVEEVSSEEVSVEEEENVETIEEKVEPKQEFTIINDVLEVYNGDGETATIPDEVVKINGSAFFSCKNLKHIVIGKNVQYISDGAFVHCTNIESISIDRENQNYRSNGNCIVDVRQRMLIFGCKNTVIPNDGSVMRIGAGAFADCVGLVTMKIPEGITFIGNSAFKNCVNLQQVNIPASASYIALNAFEKTGLLDVAVSGGGLKKCLRCGSEMPYGSNTCVCGCSYTIN